MEIGVSDPVPARSAISSTYMYYFFIQLYSNFINEDLSSLDISKGLQEQDSWRPQGFQANRNSAPPQALF